MLVAALRTLRERESARGAVRVNGLFTSLLYPRVAMGAGITNVKAVPLARGVIAAVATLLLAVLIQGGRAEAAVSSCTLTPTGVIFSPYDSQTNAAVDGAGTITVSCTGTNSNNAMSLALTGGSTGNCAPRAMRNGTPSLGYQIYREASRINTWCDGGNRVEWNFDFTSNPNQSVTLTMYGRVNGSQNPSYGSYSDTLTMTVRRTGTTIVTGTTTISGSVSPICTASAGTLGFGSYNPSAIAIGTAYVTVNCSSGAGYQVSLGNGQNVSGSTRRMVGPGGAFLSYQLFSDSNRTIPWGDGGTLGARVNGTGNGSGQALTVYGRIAAGQMTTPGSYTDRVVVTVEY